MFSIEGYISFESVVELVEDWASRIYSAYILQELGVDHQVAFNAKVDGLQTLAAVRNLQVKDIFGEKPDYQSEFFGFTIKEIMNGEDFRVAVIYHCILAKILLRLDTLVCSPSGRVMRPDNYLFLHLDRLDWVYPTWPVEKTPGLSRLFELRTAGKFSGADLAARYCFVDHTLGLVRFKNNSIPGFITSFHFSDPDFSKRFIKFQAEPFLGWSVVWNYSDFPENFALILEDIGAVDEGWKISEFSSVSEVGERKGVRRGAKPTGAKTKYYELYPEGKPEGLSYEAIAAELTEAGFAISGRQVQNYEKERLSN